jgi:hypothetical protein
LLKVIFPLAGNVKAEAEALQPAVNVMREIREVRFMKRTFSESLGSIGLACITVGMLSATGCDTPSEPDPQPGNQKAFTAAFSTGTRQVREFLSQGQGGSAKLAFVDYTTDSRLLCYIDFSEPDATPRIHTIANAVDPHVPVISPDGGWVVYASGQGCEAGSPVSMRSSVWLCRLAEQAQPVLIAADSACEPRFVQNDSADLSIIYSTLAPNFAWEGAGHTMQVSIDVSSTPPTVSTPIPLCGDGGYTGGLSWDRRYLCGGGGHVAMLDLQSGMHRPDTLSYNLIQSCNASISSSRGFTNTMMYLNTGSSSPMLNGGQAWKTWQAILISNSHSELVKGYLVPDTAGMQYPVETTPPSVSGIRWHHCEWSNHPYFATATLNVDRYFSVNGQYSNTYFQERIYLINLRDSTYLEILHPDKIKYTGTADDPSGFYWPWLWVEIPATFSESTTWLNKP